MFQAVKATSGIAAKTPGPRPVTARIPLCIAALLSALGLTAPGSAVASFTESCDGSGNYSAVATPGQANTLRLAQSGADWSLADSLDGSVGTCTGAASASVGAGDADDSLFGPAKGGTVVLDGGLGNDVVTLADFTGPWPAPTPGDYTLIGGDGNDQVVGAWSPVSQPQGVGVTERILGGEGVDNIDGKGGDDYIDAGPGDDRTDTGPDGAGAPPGYGQVVGGDGEDVILGGEGSDFLISHDGVAAQDLTVTDKVDDLDCGPGDDLALVDDADLIDLSCERFGNLGYFGCEGLLCQGVVEFTAAGGGAATSAVKQSAKRRASLGAGRFKLRGGRSTLPAARFSKKGRKLVRKRGRLSVRVAMTVTVKLRGGKVTTVRKRGRATVTES